MSKIKHPKARHSRTIKSSSKFSPVYAVLVTTAVTIAGIILISASLAATTITFYGKIQIRVLTPNGAAAIPGTQVGIQMTSNTGWICRIGGTPVWNAANGTNYATTDANGWATFDSCITYQGAYSSYTAAPIYASSNIRLMSTSHAGYTSTGCLFTSIAPGSLFIASGTKDPNGTVLPLTQQTTCMNPLPPPPPPAPTPVPTPTPPPPAPAPSPTPLPSPSPAHSTSPSPTPTSSPPTHINPPALIKKVTPPAAPPPPAPAIVNATSGDSIPPSEPGSPTATSSNNTVDVSWSAATDNVGVANYLIERSTDQDDWQTLSANLTTTDFEDLHVVSGIHYYYRIRAIDTAGNESQGAFADIELTSAEATAQAKTPISVKKSSSTSKQIMATAGVLLVFLALGGGAFWFIRHRNNLSNYDDQVRGETMDHAIQTVEVTAPHESESLKELVMHDMHANNQEHTKK